MRVSLFTRLSPRIVPSGQRSSSTLADHFVVSEEVRAAQSEGKGVVALESTVITHGLPYPTNLETGLSLERVIREGGAVPATIALIGRKIRIGLAPAELEAIAQDKSAVKVSRRDAAYTLVKGITGGTTVAATMWAAHHAGIRVFSTGGIGGVHRGAEETFDISADLIELARTPVTVVCAGIKSILDVGKTIEVLETQGVNTLVFSRDNAFPGFFSSKTPFKGQLATLKIDEVAAIIDKSALLGFPAGTILAVPLPSELEAEGKAVEEAIQQALKEASQQSIRGQAITPFLLGRVAEMTKGMSMKTNVALLENNAKVAAQLAVELASKAKERSPIRAPAHRQQSQKGKEKPNVVVIGASILDFEAITQQELKNDGGSYVGRVVQRVGGVGRNHAEALGRLGCNSILLSAIGKGSHGEYVKDMTRKHVDVSRLLELEDGTPTAVYMSMNQKGNVLYGVSCVEESVQRITPEYVTSHEEALVSADTILLDGNLPIPTVSRALEIAKAHGRRVWFEPSDIAKASKFLKAQASDAVSVISPNEREFAAILAHCGVRVPTSALASPSDLESFLSTLSPIGVLSSLDTLLITMASKGSVLLTRDGRVASKFQTSASPWGTLHRIPSPVVDPVVSVSGAGDTMNAALLSALLHGCSLEEAVEFSLKAAALTLQSTDAVAEGLSSVEKPWEKSKLYDQASLSGVSLTYRI